MARRIAFAPQVLHQIHVSATYLSWAVLVDRPIFRRSPFLSRNLLGRGATDDAFRLVLLWPFSCFLLLADGRFLHLSKALSAEYYVDAAGHFWNIATEGQEIVYKSLFR